MIPSAQLLTTLRADLTDNLVRILPELCVLAAILAPLVARVLTRRATWHAAWLAGPLVLTAIVAAANTSSAPAAPAFSQLLILDPFASFFRILVPSVALAILILGGLTGIPDTEDSADHVTLLLGASLGMMFLAQAQHLMSAFLALEMASLPSYALAGFFKGRKNASEAALKYVLFGAAASGTALYGISLLMMQWHTGSFPEIARLLSNGEGVDPVSLTGLVLFSVGLLFKLSIVPVHFWCPDVFAGASAEVGAFLSIASKAAAFALAIRFVSVLTPHSELRISLTTTLIVLAGISMTWGNLAALGQTELKRLMAYSTIAHAGTMLLGVAPGTSDGISAVLYYLSAYLPANLILFAMIALLRHRSGSENLDQLRGVMTHSPRLAVIILLAFLSLLGLPPLAGFAGKFQIFAALYEAGTLPEISLACKVGLGLGVLNTVLGAAVYLRVIRVMVLENATQDRHDISTGEMIFLGVLAMGIVLLGLVWDPLLSHVIPMAEGLAR